MTNDQLPITNSQVKHIARLANLDIDDREIARLSIQLSDILEFVKKISEVETKDAPQLANVSGKKNVFRDDKVQSSLSQQEVLRNAPSTFKGYFKVKSIFEE